jgi:hypothetical protein
MEGPELELLELTKLALSDDETDKIWSEMDPRDLLLECPSVLEMEDYEIDEMPGMSDVYYTYEVANKAVLASELRKAVLSILGRKK